MPLTAQWDDVVVDLTAIADDVWSRIYRARPRAMLLCRGCDQRVHAKRSPLGLHFFAHDAKSDCASNGETVEHLRLKTAIVVELRQLGWKADPEVPGDGWRADVLARSPSGRRYAFEAQLSSMTSDKGKYRTNRYLTDGILTVWVTTKAAPWSGGLSSVRLASADRPLMVVGGCSTYDGYWWDTPDPFPFIKFAHAIDTGGLTRHPTNPVKWGFVKPADAELDARRQRQFEREESARQRRQEAEQERFEQNRRAHVDRMERTVPLAVEHATRQYGAAAQAGQPDPRRYANGTPIFCGKQLVGVVCPVKRRIRTHIIGGWKGATIYVATKQEAAYLRRNHLRRWEFEVLPPVADS